MNGSLPCPIMPSSKRLILVGSSCPAPYRYDDPESDVRRPLSASLKQTIVHVHPDIEKRRLWLTRLELDRVEAMLTTVYEAPDAAVMPM